ncbi:unnamed protein product [Toxocara canis]|uniref:C2H2-type domain-containing protein n=1 Tax=Toxocara canis TaxID=6265 RepID=A0A183ULA3_TOXCA|nr:unnamed protein product [Toxocara canis]
MPRAIATKESLPPERVPLVIPQDNSYRYREMNLRYRKSDSGRQDVAREVESEEIAVMDRLCKYASPLIELASMMCLHSDCKEKRPFSSIFTLAYHITVKHNRRWLSSKHIPCFLCGSGFSTYETVMAHLREDHYHYHKEHCMARAKQDDEKTDSKRGRKSKCTSKVSNGRFRSLSPMSEDFVETDESFGEEESDREHEGEEEEELDVDKTDRAIKEDREGESDNNSETGSPPQSLSSVNIDIDAASPEWYRFSFIQRSSLSQMLRIRIDVIRFDFRAWGGLEPPHLSPEVQNDMVEEDNFEIETEVRETVAYLISKVAADSDAFKKECDEETKDEKNVRKERSVGAAAPTLARRVKWRGLKKRSWVLEENLKDDIRARALIRKFLKAMGTKPVVTRGAATRGYEKKRAPTENEPVHEDISKEEHRLQQEASSSSRIRGPRKTKKLPYLYEDAKKSGEERDDKGSAEKKSGKKRGRKEGSINKGISKTADDTRDDISVHSDDADETPKVRPLRHRRKPNWIDDANFVTAFKKKRSRQGASGEGDVQLDESTGRVSRANVSASGAVELQQQEQQSDLLEEDASDPTCLPPVTSLPEPTDISPPVVFPDASLPSNEGSLSRQVSPSPEMVLPPDETPRLPEREKGRLYRSLSPRAGSHSPSSIGPYSVVSDPGIVLPASFVPPVRRYGSDYGQSGTTPKSLKKEKELADSRFLYTPRARKLKFGEDELRTEYDEEHDENTASASSTSSHSRRKQNLSKIHENDNITIVRLANGRAPPRPEDLSEIPVYLTEMQRDLFFSFIRPASTSTEGAQKCMQCGKIVASLMVLVAEGRRHAVGHLRIMRLRCSLCDCGSFFCSDMRTHLQYRHCPKLLFAPRGYVLPGNVVPCMTQRQVCQ